MKYVIGCAGRARHGKGTAATVLAHMAKERGINVQVISFADSLKSLLTLWYGKAEPFRGGDAARNTPLPDVMWGQLSPYLYERAKESGMDVTKNPTGRNLLQLMGSDVLRSCFCGSFWVDIARSRAANWDGVTILDDVRFVNEARPASQLNGVLDLCIRIRRPALPQMTHISETSVDDIPADFVAEEVINDGSVEQLEAKIKVIANKYLPKSSV